MSPLKLQHRPLVSDDIVEFFDVWSDILEQKGRPGAAVLLKTLRCDFRRHLDELLLGELQEQGTEQPELHLERRHFALSTEGIESAKGLVRYFVNTALEREELTWRLHQLNNPPFGGAN